MAEIKKTIVVPTVPPNSDDIVLMDGDIPVYIRKSAVDAFHGIEVDATTGLPARFRVIVRGGFQFLITGGAVAEEQLINALARSVWPDPTVVTP